MSMFTNNSKITGRQAETTFQYRGRSEPLGWRGIGAMLGLGGGLLCNFFGFSFTAVAWFMRAGEVGPTLHSVGTVLLVANIPLLIGGAHCLDLVEKERRVAAFSN